MPVEVRTDSGAGIITMTDGTGGNRLNPPLISELQRALDELAASDSVRFILLRSNGPTFSHGMDLIAFRSGGPGQAVGEFEAGVKAYAGLLDSIHRCPKTVVGLVQGSAKAGGVGLAAACDAVIAAETADFELSELYLGLIPANVMPYVLAVRMPAKRAAYMVQTAARIDARTALAWGLADEVHPAANLEKALRSLGRRLMRLSPRAVARQKAFVSAIWDLPFEDRGAMAVAELVETASDREVLDAVRVFADGDLPPWFDGFRPGEPLALFPEEN